VKEEAMGDDSSRIRILAVDDHPLLRQGMAALLATQPDLSLVAEAADGREAIHQFRTHRPDVTLMDLLMPGMGGVDATIAIRGDFPAARIVVLTTYAGDVQILRAVRAGACGYLLKNQAARELLDMIRAVHAGRKVLAAEASYSLSEHAADKDWSPTDLDILRLIAAGHANKQIAAQLSTTEDTVKGRIRKILSRLGANDRTHAAMIGLKRGIIDA
jgi:DNA-binding NarL/FixJ family response regulator